MVSWLLDKPLEIRPLMVSKVNTLAQFLLAALVLATGAFGIELGQALTLGITVVGVLTGLSAAAYLLTWTRHMAS